MEKKSFWSFALSLSNDDKCLASFIRFARLFFLLERKKLLLFARDEKVFPGNNEFCICPTHNGTREALHAIVT